MSSRPSDSRRPAVPTVSPESPEIDEMFVAAWRQHSAQIHDRCRTWMGGSEADADEAFSHAGLRIYRKLRDHHQEVKNLETWMLRVTQNVCRNLHRERKRQPEGELDQEVFESCLPKPWAAHPATGNPEERYLHQELERFLSRSIAELPESLQSVMRVHLDSTNHREVAARLGINEASVRKRMQRAREILRRQLAGYRSGLPAATEQRTAASPSRDHRLRPRCHSEASAGVFRDERSQSIAGAGGSIASLTQEKPLLIKGGFMATQYAVNITMSQATVTSLSNGTYSLFGFKGVQTTLGGGAPLVWFATQTYSTATVVNWQEQYMAYTSTSAIIPNGTINASNSVDIDLGQTFNVTDKTGTGTVTAGGVSGAISILNSSGVPFTCGISQAQGGTTPNPICAFPLYGTGLDVIAPIEQVLLTFATNQINTGTVIEKAYAPGFLIDLTGAPNNTRSVSFDINSGWSCNSCTWAQQVPPNANLLPLLIDNSPSAVLALTKALPARLKAKA